MSEVDPQARETATRIRWHEDELELVATEMVRLELNKQGANELERVRMAQVVLPVPRQREIKTWSAMHARLQPHIDRIRAKADSAPLLFSVETESKRSASVALESAAAVCAPLVASQMASEIAAQVTQAARSASPGLDEQAAPPAQAEVVRDAEPQAESALSQDEQPLSERAPEAAAVEHSSSAPQSAAAPSASALQTPSSVAVPESVTAMPSQETPLSSSEALAQEAPVASTAEPQAPQAAAVAPESAPESRPQRLAASTAPAGAQAVPQTVSLDPLMVEASLVAALQSPLVVQSLVDVFAQAMAKALSCLNVQVGQPSGASAASTRMRGNNIFPSRVLLAGFSTATAQALEQSLSGLCEVRIWRPNHGPQLFETLAKVCQVAVIPDEMEEGVDQDLRARNLVVIRHSGNINKLTERLEAVLS